MLVDGLMVGFNTSVFSLETTTLATEDVPTLSEWGIIMLIAFLLGIYGRKYKTKKQMINLL